MKKKYSFLVYLFTILLFSTHYLSFPAFAENIAPVWCKSGENVSMQFGKTLIQKEVPISVCIRNDSEQDAFLQPESLQMIKKDGEIISITNFFDALKINSRLSLPKHTSKTFSVLSDTFLQSTLNEKNLIQLNENESIALKLTYLFEQNMQLHTFQTTLSIPHSDTVKIIESLKPSLQLSGCSLKPNTNITLTGVNFPINKQVSILQKNALNLQGINFGNTIMTSSTGSFSVTANIGSVSGNNTLIVDKSNFHGEAAFSILKYNPTASPSAYYILPGNMFGYSGEGFAPNEIITLLDCGNNVLKNFKADENGVFLAKDVFLIDYSLQNNLYHQKLIGEISDQAVDFNVKVGTFYPHIDASSYYIKKGGVFNVSGANFAPNELIDIMINNIYAGSIHADARGSVTFDSQIAPESGRNFQVRAIGNSSHQTSTQTITIAG